MDTRKLADILCALGIILTVIAIAWWASFYGAIAEQTGATLGDAKSCIYSKGGPCAVVTFFSQMSGRTPYSPVVFWIGVGSVACGAIIRLAQKSE